MNNKNHSITAIALTLLLCTTAYAGNDRDRDDDHRGSGSHSSGKYSDRNDRASGWGWNDGHRDDDDDKWDRDERWDDDDWGKTWFGSWKYELDDWKNKGWGNSHGDKVFICHRTSSRSNPYVLIKVSTSAKQAHLDHGDPAEFTEFGNGGCRPVTPPPQNVDVTLSITPATIGIGEQARLAWSSTGAKSCKLQGSGSLYSKSFTVSIDDSGYYMKGPFSKAGQATYTVTCTGPGGSDAETVTLTVEPAVPPPTLSLTLAASSIEVGATTTATWTSTNTSSCTLSNGATSSPAVVGPYTEAGNVTLTLTCIGLNGNTVTASQVLTVSAPPPTPPVELTACSRLDSNNTLYFWAVDYYPDTGAFDGISSSGTGPISGTISPAGDIMTAGKTITYSVDELGGVSSSASTVVDLDPTGDVLVGAYFRATNPVTGRNAAIAFVPGTTAACNLPAPR